MDKTTIQKAGLGLAALAIAFGAGYYFAPAKVVTKERVITQVKRDIKTVIVTKPDGTVKKVVTEKDRSKTEKDKSTVKSKPEDKWLLGVQFGIERDGFTFSPKPSTVVFSLQRQTLFGVCVGPWVSMAGDFGIGLSLKL